MTRYIVIKPPFSSETSFVHHATKFKNDAVNQKSLTSTDMELIIYKAQIIFELGILIRGLANNRICPRHVPSRNGGFIKPDVPLLHSRPLEYSELQKKGGLCKFVLTIQ